jgi:hypothetical protein
VLPILCIFFNSRCNFLGVFLENKLWCSGLILRSTWSCLAFFFFFFFIPHVVHVLRMYRQLIRHLRPINWYMHVVCLFCFRVCMLCYCKGVTHIGHKFCFILMPPVLCSDATSLDWKISSVSQIPVSRYGLRMRNHGYTVYWVWNVGKTFVCHI